MKYRIRWPLTLLLIVGALLVFRLVWMISSSAIGWQPHLDSWSDVATDLVGIKTKSLSEKDPQEQAEFWLQQVHQVEQANIDAETALGAAWMLDTPHPAFYVYRVKTNEGLDIPGFSSWRSRDLDEDIIEALTKEFELLCVDECLEKIETALRLDSDNVEMWRAYALLLFRKKYSGFEMVPRKADWQSVLNECAKHDPENALYDYLAASYLWSSSAEYPWQAGKTVLIMKDRATFDLGTQRYQAGLAKPKLNFGTISYAATLHFLNETSVPVPDQVTAAENREIGGRITSLLFQMLRLQYDQAKLDQEAEKYSVVNQSARNLIRVSDQVLNGDGQLTNSFEAHIIRFFSFRFLKEINESQSDLMDEVEARTISEEYLQLQLESEVLIEVQKRYKVKAEQYGVPIWTLLIIPTVQMCFLVSFCLA
ncbi:MAG: hypothetical protein P1V19_24500, partial [Gimesia sp.]|nr:hypothetical protein [Gimesia sp.]